MSKFIPFLVAATTACAGSPPTEPDPEPGIALTLAESRARAIGHVRYDLSFVLPADPMKPIAGRAVVRFQATDVSRPLVLDFAAGPERLHSMAVNGGRSAATLANGHIVVSPGELRAGENTIEIAFAAGDAPLNRTAEFLYALFVPARAHLAFPCFDQPDLKARYTLELTVPAGWAAVSNGAERARDAAGDGIRVRFAETEPIPTYLFTFAAGRFQVESAERNGRTFRMLHRETDARKVARNRDTVFDLHAASLAWLEQYTAIPYRFGKFDFVLLPSFQFSGMEHPGAVFYNASAVLLDESATESQMLGRASLIAHETAHMWFGDLVTMRWFDDVWMKEVFANFMAAKIVNPSFPNVNHELRFLVAHYPAAYGVDRTAGTHPIRQALANLSEAGSLYGPIIYQKAPIVMRQLERLLGADGLRDGLRAYLAAFAFGNATWLDLVRVLDERTDRDLAAWSRAWVEEAGRPTIRTVIETDGAGLRQLTFVQQDARTDRGLLWTQQIEALAGTVPVPRSIALELQSSTTEVPRALVPPAIDFVLPNGGGLAYGGFVLDARSRTFLLQRVANLADPLTRGAAWVTLWDEMLDGRVPPAGFLDAALAALARETIEQNVQLVTGYAEETFWRFLTDAARHAAAARLEQTLRGGIARARTTSAKATWFSAFRGTATTAGAVAWLERVWRRREKIPGLTLAEPDEATLALELAVRSVPGAASILDEQRARFTNPDRKARFEFVMPAVGDRPEMRDAWFARLADVTSRRREPWVVEGLAYLNHPLRAPDAGRYVRPALDLLQEIQRTGDIFFPTNWTRAVVGGHRSKAAADTVRRFLADHPDFPARLRRVILQASDDLFRAASM